MNQITIGHDEPVFAECAHVWIINELAQGNPIKQFDTFAQFANWKKYTGAGDVDDVTLYMFLVPGFDEYIGFFGVTIERAAAARRAAMSKLIPDFRMLQNCEVKQDFKIDMIEL